MERKNAIITGGAGFIASHLSPRLLKEGFNKIFLIDNLMRTQSLRNIPPHDKIEFIYGDAGELDYKALPDVSHCFHLASPKINRCAKFNREGHSNIVSPAINIVDFCAHHNVKLFFASTASVYNKPQRFPIAETDTCQPHTIYGAGKYYTECLLRSYENMHGLDYVINRFFSVYGPHMDSSGVYTEVIFNWLNNIKNGDHQIKVFGNPDEKILDLVYVSDVIDAIILSTFTANHDVFNVSTQNGVTLRELITAISKVTNTDLTLEVKEENRTDIENKRVGDTSKLRALGWVDKVNLKEGLLKTWNWINDTKNR